MPPLSRRGRLFHVFMCAKCLIEYQRRQQSPTWHTFKVPHRIMKPGDTRLLYYSLFFQRNQLINALLTGVCDDWAQHVSHMLPFSFKKRTPREPARLLLVKNVSSSRFIDVFFWESSRERKIHLQGLLYNIKKKMNCCILWQMMNNSLNKKKAW